jgi:hypothetical protein
MAAEAVERDPTTASGGSEKSGAPALLRKLCGGTARWGTILVGRGQQSNGVRLRIATFQADDSNELISDRCHSRLEPRDYYDQVEQRGTLRGGIPR